MTNVIKYEGDNNVFIWKHPCEDFDDKTQLIVHESQEAIFMLNGQALDTLGAGRHTLTTEKIPLLRKIINKIAGKETSFHCEVYFINKSVQMSIKWGTDSKVRFLDPNYGVPLEIGASGEMNMCVADAKTLLVKLVGTMSGIAWEDRGDYFTKSLQRSFRPLISTHIKANLSEKIQELEINILDIDKHLKKLSEVLRDSINEGFEEYGLTIPQFYVTTVLLPEDDPNFRLIRSMHSNRLRKEKYLGEADILAAQRKVILEEQANVTEIARSEADRDLLRAQVEVQTKRMSGLADADIMRAKGYTEKDVLQADVQKAFAQSLSDMGANGGGSIMSDMIGMGIGMSSAKQFGEAFKGMLGGTMGLEEKKEEKTEVAQKIKCPICEFELPANAKFCIACGAKVEPIDDTKIVCPMCGSRVNKGKFCLICGEPLQKTCPSCGKELSSDAKFCFECGEKLQA